MTVSQRLFDPTDAFEHPVTLGIVTFIVVGLLSASIMLRVVHRVKKLEPDTQRELLSRTRSWYFLATAMVLPILFGAAWVIGFFLLLSLFCFREYSKATDLGASRTATVATNAAILLTFFAALDHWTGLFTTSWTLGICGIAVASLVPDEPRGYIRRVGLSILGFSLFGIGLGHLAFISNDALFRPMLLWILLCTELNDVFAYLAGKTIGRRKLLPKTSPNKTVGGALGAVFLTSLLSLFIGRFVFQKTSLDQTIHLLMMGLLISVLGQCGDLVVSSIKRDLGIKDMASVIPGHGGLLDRFDSLLFVAPVLFHYVNYFMEGGIGNDTPVRILTGG